MLVLFILVLEMSNSVSYKDIVFNGYNATVSFA